MNESTIIKVAKWASIMITAIGSCIATWAASKEMEEKIMEIARNQ